jgi:hypothetical protein
MHDLINCSQFMAPAPSKYSLSQNICRFRFPRNNFDKIYIKNINIYGV